MNVHDYFSKFTNTEGVEIIRRNYDFLRRTRDVIVVEGAGSPAEINISSMEIANMRTAEITHASCLLVVNIEWGGAFAYIYGTLQLLSPEHKRMFKGIIINNLRGSKDSLAEGIRMIEEEVGIPVLGVVPHIDHALPDEDSMSLRSSTKEGDSLHVGVVRLPRISNFTDYDALSLEEGISVSFVEDPARLREMDAIIIPGTKNTIADLNWMREKGLYEAIREMRSTVPILGVCGGYQMLGKTIVDAQGLEGGMGQECAGLDLLDVTTYFETYDKRTVQVEGRMIPNGEAIRGYEIHMGRTENPSHRALFAIDDGRGEKLDGAVSQDGMVMGTYVHGLFDLPPFRRHFISLIRRKGLARHGRSMDYDQAVEDSLDRLAANVRENIDMDRILEMVSKEVRG
jgi:adenosylcobyric acid synthase